MSGECWKKSEPGNPSTWRFSPFELRKCQTFTSNTLGGRQFAHTLFDELCELVSCKEGQTLAFMTSGEEHKLFQF